MPYQEGQTAGNGAYIYQNGGWVSNPARAPITGPAGENPPYQALSNATPTGSPIPGPTFQGRGLPGGTPGQKAGNLATAVSSGFGVGRALAGKGLGLGAPAAAPPAAPSPSSGPPPAWGPGANRFITNVQNNIKALQQQQQPPSPTGPTPPPQTAVQSPMGAPSPAAKPSDWAFIRKLLMGETVKDTVGHVIKSLLNAP